MHGWKGLLPGRVKQGNYHIHVLYTIPKTNYTLPIPYPFIKTYPIHHPTLGTQTGRVLPCASINSTLPWIPTYQNISTSPLIKMSHITILFFILVHNFQHKYMYQSFKIVRPFICLYVLEFYSPVSIDVISGWSVCILTLLLDMLRLCLTIANRQ